MNIPEDLKYTKDHEWARREGNVLTVGITDYAQDQLGDIVFVELPEEGEEVKKDEGFGVVESTKAVSDCLAPASGRVAEVNLPLQDSPEIINDDPYEEGWLIRIEMSNPKDYNSLMDADEYKRHIKEVSE